MATSTLILHRGAREVTREEFESLPVPPATKTWAPVSHSRVLDTAVATLREAGFTCVSTRLALSANGHRFF